MDDMKKTIASALGQKFSFGNPAPTQYTKAEAIRMLTRYPDRIPVIVTRSKSSSDGAPEIDKNKFLVPRDLTMGQLQYVVRKRIKLGPEKALFLFVGGSCAPTHELVSNVFEECQCPDTLFLYVEYSLESVFG